MGRVGHTNSYVGPIHTGFGDDKELMAVDNDLSSPHFGRIYVGWTDFARFTDLNVVSFSDNGGLTWSSPVPLPGSGTRGQGMWPAVAPNCDVYFGLAHLGLSIGSTQDQIIYKSTDGGVSWVRMTDIGTGQLRPENVTASTNCFRQALNGDIRHLSPPQIAIHRDVAAPAGYVIHAVYAYDSDGAGGDESNVFYTQSRDVAVTWSAQTKLNDEATTTDQWFPAVGVNSNGVVVATWYDRRLNPVTNLDFDRFAAISQDGGLTWGANFRVSDVSSPVSQNNPHFDGLAICYHGDYDQVAIDNTKAHFVWSDDRRITTSGPNPDVYYDQTLLTSATVQVTLRSTVTSVPLGDSVPFTVELRNETNEPQHFAFVLTLTPFSAPEFQLGSDPIVLGPNGMATLDQTFPIPLAGPLGTWRLRGLALQPGPGLVDDGNIQFEVVAGGPGP